MGTSQRAQTVKRQRVKHKFRFYLQLREFFLVKPVKGVVE